MPSVPFLQVSEGFLLDLFPCWFELSLKRHQGETDLFRRTRFYQERRHLERMCRGPCELVSLLSASLPAQRLVRVCQVHCQSIRRLIFFFQVQPESSQSLSPRAAALLICTRAGVLPPLQGPAGTNYFENASSSMLPVQSPDVCPFGQFRCSSACCHPLLFP